MTDKDKGSTGEKPDKGSPKDGQNNSDRSTTGDKGSKQDRDKPNFGDRPK